MLRQRLLSAVVLVPALFAVIWYAPSWLFSAAVGAAALLGVLEFYQMVAQTKGQPLILFGSLWTLLFIANAHYGSPHTAPVLSSAVVLSLIWVLFRSDIENAFVNWAWTLGGMLYVGWMLSYFILLRGLDDGRQWALLALFATFAADTTAYFVGRAWGRHSMAQAISPGKTWEGAIGGSLGGLAATIVLALILGQPIGWKIVLLGCLIPVFAQLGDLVESLLKRSTGVKEAGRLIPGHGGILDRLDSIVFTVVVVYYYVYYVLG